MFQGELDGLKFGDALKEAGSGFLGSLSTQLSTRPEATADQNQAEDVSGAPTPNQQAAAGSFGAMIDSRTLFIGGGVAVLVAVVIALKN